MRQRTNGELKNKKATSAEKKWPLRAFQVWVLSDPVNGPSLHSAATVHMVMHVAEMLVAVH